MDEKLLIQLRDCFTGGYTLPQFCIDNGIKKPLFVAEGKSWQFVWEIYVQFHYDKRMTAQFSFLDVASDNIDFRVYGFINALEIKHISKINPAEVDAVICHFIRKTYVEIPLLHFLQLHPQVKLILTNCMSIERYKGGKEFDLTLYGVGEFTNRLRADKSGNVKTTLDRFGYTNAQVLELSETPVVITNPDGSTLMEDTDENSLQRIRNGKRVTAYQPEHFKNKIYFIGNCISYGVYAPFDKTIESYLQLMLNEHNLPYRVENESQVCWSRTQDILYNLNTLNPAPGDIIFVVIEGQRATGNAVPFFDINVAFDRPHDFREMFCVKGHVNELGYKFMAEKFFKFLTTNNFFRDVYINYSAPPPVNLFAATVYRRNSRRAARRPSSTRSLRLTSKNFARKKFLLVPSSGYFNKAQLQDVTVDSSRDVEIFGREIAPTLGITIRFAGEEPTDTVTRQYNETMREILPRYGVEFREIPRKTFGGEVISTSTVREALKRGDFDTIEQLVPDTTLLYLRGRQSAMRKA